MRALWLTSSYPRDPSDASGVFLHTWARALVSRGMEIRVIAPGAPGVAGREELDGVEVIRFPYYFPRSKQRLAYRNEGFLGGLQADRWSRVQIVPFLANFARYAWREARDADLIHAFWTPMGAIGLLVRLLRVRPLVLSPLGSDLRFLPDVFNRTVIGLSQAVVAGGDQCTEVYDRLIGMMREAPYPIFLPIDEPQLDAGDGDAFRREQGIKDERVVTFVGRLCEGKDPLTFLRAAPFLLSHRPGIRFVMVGGGPLLSALRATRAELGLEREVIFTGVRRDIGSILKASDVFVSLSPESNCWSTTIAEAMHMGVPCVVSDTGLERRLFPHREAAWLVPPRDPQALAGALDCVLGDVKVSKQLSEGGRDLLQTHRRKDDLILQDTMDMYESVIRAHGSAPRLLTARGFRSWTDE